VNRDELVLQLIGVLVGVVPPPELEHNGLGSDQHGRDMLAAYMERIQEINRLMAGRW
jgi:hypothetical protein